MWHFLWSSSRAFADKQNSPSPKLFSYTVGRRARALYVLPSHSRPFSRHLSVQVHTQNLDRMRTRFMQLSIEFSFLVNDHKTLPDSLFFPIISSQLGTIRYIQAPILDPYICSKFCTAPSPGLPGAMFTSELGSFKDRVLWEPTLSYSSLFVRGICSWAQSPRLA